MSAMINMLGAPLGEIRTTAVREGETVKLTAIDSYYNTATLVLSLKEAAYMVAQLQGSIWQNPINQSDEE